MRQITLAKACRRRKKGAPMMVTDRAAFHMMETGEAVRDENFMAAFAKNHRLPMPKKADVSKPVPELPDEQKKPEPPEKKEKKRFKKKKKSKGDKSS